MKRFLAGILSILLFFPGAPTAGARMQTAHLESLTQEEAVETALSRHPRVQKARTQVERARTRLSEAHRWFHPRIAFYAGERLDVEGHRVGIQLSQELDDVWNRSKIRDAEAELVLAEQDLSLTCQTVVEEAVSAYHTWLRVREEYRRASRRVPRVRHDLAHAWDQYEEGLISRAQIRELEQSLENAERAYGETFAHFIQSAVRLRQAMGELGVL